MADEPTVLHPLPALLTLAAFMEGRQRAGQQRIWMSEPARQALKEMIRMKPGRMEVRPVVVASVVEPKEEPKEEIVLERVETVPVVMVPKVETVVETVVEREEPVVSVMVVERTREEKEEALAKQLAEMLDHELDVGLDGGAPPGSDLRHELTKGFRNGRC
jgi:hypothetical protein